MSPLGSWFIMPGAPWVTGSGHRMKRLRISAIIALTALFPACAVSQVNNSRPTIKLTPVEAPRLDIAESRAMYLFSRSRISSLEGDQDVALALLRAAAESDPTSAQIHVAMAGIYLKMNKPLQALSACETAIELDPNSFKAHQLAGSILAGLNRDKESAEHFKRAIEIDSTREEVYIHLAVTYVKFFEYEEAINTLKKLIKVAPDNAFGYYYLGKTYDQMKLNREAIQYYRKALELKPDFDQAMIDLAISLETQGLASDAIETYRNLLEDNPQNLSVTQHLIQLLIQQQRLEEALVLLLKMDSINQGGLETKRKIGLINLELERYDEAIRVFSTILEQEPEANQIRYYLGNA